MWYASCTLERWDGLDWIGLAQDRNRWRALVNSVLNLHVPWNAGKLSSGLASSGLSSIAQLHRVSQLVSYVSCTEAHTEQMIHFVILSSDSLFLQYHIHTLYERYRDDCECYNFIIIIK
jgi:hypothetical protein